MCSVRSVVIAAVVTAAALISAATASQSDSPKSSGSQELFDELASKDSTFFEAVFTTCDLDSIGKLITDDFEFYHDKWGQIANSKLEFVESIRNLCARQESGVDYRARRELARDSVAVYPLTNYGAIQMGTHRFYRVTGGQEDKLTEVATFTHLWKKDNGDWKLSRVLSYDHKQAE